MNWNKWDGTIEHKLYQNRWIQALNRINRPIITTCTWHLRSVRLQLRLLWQGFLLTVLPIGHATVLFPFAFTVFFFSLSCSQPYNFPFVLQFPRSGPDHVELSLHRRENRYPVDAAQRSLLLHCSVSRWFNNFSALVNCFRCVILSQRIKTIWLWWWMEILKSFVWKAVLYVLTLPSCVQHMESQSSGARTNK